MLSRKEIDRMTAAMQKSVEQMVETIQGECIAVDDETGTEYGHKWRDGEARVFCEGDDDESPASIWVAVDYVYRVRVELVAVERN